MSIARPARRALSLPLTNPTRTLCTCTSKNGRAQWKRSQSTKAGPTPKPPRDRRYYLLALPIALLPIPLFGLGFGSSKRPLDPYTYSDHPIASTSKLSPQHARIRIPLSSSDASSFTPTPTSFSGITDGRSGEVVVLEHVMIKNPDLQIERPYTPINDVGKEGEVDLIVKRVQGGEVGRMIHRLQPGGIVGLRGPIPTCSIRPGQYDKIVMISTGTGVAPFLQLLKKMPPSPSSDQGGALELELIHSLPRPSDLDLDLDFIKHESVYPTRPDLKITRPAAGPVPVEVLESALAPRKEGKKVLVLVCLPQSLMRPLCGGLTIDMKQGAISGTLGQMGLTNAAVYKLE